jgi:hypothetical protein
MKYLSVLILMGACTPQALNDFVIGEEKVIEQLIYDESGYPVGQAQKSEEQSPTRAPKPAVRLNVITF